MTRRRLLLIILGLLLLAPVAGVVYLTQADFSGYREEVEEIVSQALGCDFSIAGAFEPTIGLTSEVVAWDVTLAAGTDAVPMVHIDRLRLTLDLWSLVSGPVRVPELEVQGARVRFEVEADGLSNWRFDAAPDAPTADDAPSDPVVVQFERVVLEQIVATYGNEAAARSAELRLDSATADLVDGGLLDLKIVGAVNDGPLKLDGTVGPLEALFRNEEVEHDLRGRLGTVELAFRGSMASLATLADPRLELSVTGADLSEVTSRFELPSLGTGPFHLLAKTYPAEGAVAVEIASALGDLTGIEIRGHVSSLLEPESVSFDVDGSGPDLAAVGALFGFDELPPGSFDVSGYVERDGSDWIANEVAARVGDTTLTAHGTLGAFPRMAGTDFTFAAEGPDLSAFSPLATVDLPPGSFGLRGNVVRRDGKLAVERVVARFAGAELRIDGTIGDPPEFAGTDLLVQGGGPDLSAFSSLAGVDLPRSSFHVDGRLAEGENAVTLDSIVARLGEIVLELDGSLEPAEGWVGSEARLHLTGPDLREIGALFDYPDLPDEGYEVRGRLRVTRGGYELRSVTGTLGDVNIHGSGRITSAPGLVGTELDARVGGPHLSEVARLAGLPDLPDEAFDVRGVVRVGAEGYALEDVEIDSGGTRVHVHGRLGATPQLHGTDLHLDARGDRLSAIGPYIPSSPELPEDPFSISGQLRIEEDTYLLDGVEIELGGNRLEAHGMLGPLPELRGSDLTARLTGMDLAEFARMAATVGLVELPEMPHERFSVAGRVLMDAEGYALHGVTVGLGDRQARIEGRVGSPPDWYGTRLAVDAEGPEPTTIAAMLEVDLPAEPFSIGGAFEKLPGGFGFRSVSVQLGRYRAQVDGTLGELPHFAGTRLDVSAEGPDLALLEEVGRRLDWSLPELPRQPFTVSAHLDGTPEEFQLDRFRVRIGDSDLKGQARIDLRGTPDVRGEFSSRRIELTQLLPLGGDEPVPSEEPTGTKEDSDGANRKTKKTFVVSDRPLQLDELDTASGDLHWSADELVLPGRTLSNVELGIHLHDGALEVDPVGSTGALGGRLTARGSLLPVAAGFRVQASVRLDEVRVGAIKAGDDLAATPPLDVDLEFDGTGRSPHEIMSTANGYMVIDMGAGRVAGTPLDVVSADVLVTLFETLNPGSRQSDSTEIECAVLVVNLEDGRARMKPLAVRTDRSTVVGNGTIRFENEGLDLQWAAKPRKGVGVSASAITNPYLKLGGTLGDPAIEIKPINATLSTGAAVATAGISILARGMWDRVTAEKKVCRKARKEAERLAAEWVVAW